MITNELSTVNGWATVGYNLFKELIKRHEVVVLSKSHVDNKFGRFVVITAQNYYNSWLKLIRDFCRSKRFLCNTKIDIIICNVEPLLPLGGVLKYYLSARLILIGHGTYVYYPFIRLPYKGHNKIWAKFVDKIVVPSRFTYKKAMEWYRGGNIDIIPWGVDTVKYYPLSMDKEDKERAFVFVGSQKLRKGIQFLVPAFKKLVSDYPDVVLYIVGRETKLGKILVRKYKLSKNVVFTGQVTHEKLLEFYSKSIAHVLPSVNAERAFEGFGLVHLEANACGIPTIGSSGTANEDVIIDGYNGFLCPQGDVQCIYEKMKLLLEDKDLLLKMQKNALWHARNNTWEKTAKQFEKVFEELE